MRNKNKTFKLKVLAGFVAMAVVAPSMAVELEEIVVTARKVDESLLDTPIAVSVMTGKFFEESGFNTIAEVVKFIPGFDFSPITTTRAAAPTIRGISTLSFSEGIESSVATIIDGVVMGREAQGFFDLYDIERVEVLKGPQGTLFGKNSSAGVVNVVTKNPEFEFSGGGDVMIGSYGERRIRGSVTGPLIDDKLAYRITASTNENDGLLENKLEGEDDINSKDTWSVRAKLLFTPTDELSAVLTVDTTKEDNACCVATYRSVGTPDDLNNGALGGLYGGADILSFLNVPGSVPSLVDALAAAGVTPSDSNRSVAMFDDSVRQVSEAKGVALELNYELGDATLTSISAWRDWDIDETNDQDLLGEADFFNFSGAVGSAEQISQEFRLLGSFNDSTTYVAGLFYFNEEQEIDGGNTLDISLGTPFGFDILNVFTRSVRAVETTNFAAFGEVTWNATDRLSVIAGLRYTDEEKQAEANYTETVIDPRFGFNSIGITGGPVAGEVTVTDTNVSGRIIGRYHVSDDFNTYLTWSRGYKGAGIDVTTGVHPANIEVEGELPVLKPEIPTLIELGFKGRFMDNTLAINTALYHQTVEDYQRVARPGGLTTPSSLGIAEVLSKGIETDITYAAPIEGLTFSAAFSYIDITYVDFSDKPALEGSRIVSVPKASASLIGDYRFSLGDTGWSGSSRFEYSWQDEKNTSLDNLERFDMDAYGLLNLRFGATSPSGDYSATLSVENAMDEDYAYAIFSPIWGSFDNTTTAQFTGPDRTVRLTIGAKF